MFVFQMAKGADGQAKKALDEETRNTINSRISQGLNRKIIGGAALELDKAGLTPELVGNFIQFAALVQSVKGINFKLVIGDRLKALLAVINGKEDTFGIGAYSEKKESKEARDRVALYWNSVFERLKLELTHTGDKYGYALTEKAESLKPMQVEERTEEQYIPKYIVLAINKNEENPYDGKVVLKMAANCVAIAKNKDEAKMLFIDSFDPAKITDAAKQMVELYLNDVQERGQLQQGFEGMAETAEKFIKEYEEQSENLAETSREVIGSFFEYWFSTKKAGSGKFSDEEPI